MSGTPEVGNEIVWELGSARPASPAVLIIGVGRSNIPLDPIGMIGCSLYAPIVVQLGGVTDANGRTTFRTTLPCYVITSVGLRMHSQFAIIDFGAPHVLKVVSTNGMEMLIGGFP